MTDQPRTSAGSDEASAAQGPAGRTPVLPTSLAILGAALSAVVLWGATPIATKLAVQDMPALTVGMLRTTLAAVLIAPVLLHYRLGPPRRAAQCGLLALVTGGSLIAFPLLFSLGMSRTSASHAGLILAALPLPTGLFGAAFERLWPPGPWWLGAAVASIGELLLIGLDPGLSQQGATLGGDLLVALAMLSAALGHVAGARLAPSFGTWPTTLWGILLGGLILLPALLWQDRAWSPAAVGAAAWAALAFLVTCSTLLAFAAWYWALSRGGIARMGALQFLQPVVALALAAVVLDEPLSPPLLGATALILAGVALTQRRGPWLRR